MKTYSDLELNHFYLIIESEGEEIVLVEPIFQTETSVLTAIHDDEETTFWRKKGDEIFEVVEELTDEKLSEYEILFEEEEDELEEDDEL